ncbi:MAG: sugar ABC transporter permease [Chloroflexi bacterium]|nr:sugar ABC transporter permease [Chloroflexota bacterium]
MPKRTKFRITPYLFIAPTFILIFIFSYYAVFNAIDLSFTDASVGFNKSFVGLENYKKLFANAVFWTTFKNQAIITVTSIFNNIFFPLLAAELLFFIRNRKLADITKTVFVIPMLVPSIVTILTWRYLYNNDFGFNTLLNSVGLESLARNWLNDPQVAIWAIILVGFPYVSGLYFLIFHAGINGIGTEIFEAALIDGVNNLQMVTKIHLPNVIPYINVVFTLSLIGSLSGFGLVAATTGGGPGNATMIPSMLMYQVAFGEGNFGYASAIGVMLLLIIMVLTLSTRKIIFPSREES